MNNELYHYGVVGMRWGIRKQRYDKVFNRSVKKANTLDKAVTKRKIGFDTKRTRMLKAQSSFFTGDRKMKRIQRKSAKAELAYRRTETKALRWKQTMEREFSKIPASKVSEETKKKGQNYVHMLMNG